MKRLAMALVDLAKSFVARPTKPPQRKSTEIHWTKFDKPFQEMSEDERKIASKRIADEMLEHIKNKAK